MYALLAVALVMSLLTGFRVARPPRLYAHLSSIRFGNPPWSAR